MKFTLPALLLPLFILFISSCKKDDGPQSSSSVLLNGIPFNGRLSVFKAPDQSIYFEIVRPDSYGDKEMDINFSFLPITSGISPLYHEIYDANGNVYTRPNARLNTVVGGDAGCGDWEVLAADSLTNQITVTQSTDNSIDGIFSVSFLKVRDCSVRTYPDTLRFTEGKFHLVF